ncbi:oleoyl-acyl carrier protein thioesterase 1, chloroplastic-like [Macadamia integrifolia]|uniref:oleoyl-acyl carrier protein thioesterase 1, chloroplastic-like n=1 Tax=Macadamia integrifolia TaxID=60698 RepID=UPI001C4EEDFF|nr:oleoyl-acyl carrier protein thioesterase 1, chloroplastic-like [Macadamia integrifolia]
MMSLKGLNPPDQFRTLTRPRSVHALRSLNRRGIAVVSCCSSSVGRSCDLSISKQINGSGEASIGSTDESVNLADQFRFGRLTDDMLAYKRKFVVRWYEVGFNNTAAVIAITNLLQEAGCSHLQCTGYSKDGIGTGDTMRKMHLIWVTTRMQIELHKYPTWGDVVEIETWLELGRVTGKRDWIIRDATGAVIGRATSKWAVMNQDTRRLQKMGKDELDDLPNYCPRTTRLAFPEENNSRMKKIPKLEEPAQYSTLGLKPRRADLDMNQHVNNVTYIGWVLESMPQEIIDTHEVQKVTLDYRRECQQDDMVDSLTSMELVMEGSEVVAELSGSKNGSLIGRKHEEDCYQFLHCLRMSSGGPEINRGRTEWRRKPIG